MRSEIGVSFLGSRMDDRIFEGILCRFDDADEGEDDFVDDS